MKDAFRFGTVGSPNSTPKGPGGSVGAVVHLAEQQLNALELGWVRSVRVSEETCERIRRTAEQHDVLLSVHAPYFINLNADKTEWPKSRKRLMDAAHYGYLAGATDIVFHPGSYLGLQSGDALKITIPRIQACVTELRARGIMVRLRPETMGKSALLGSLNDVLEMSTQVDGVEPCLDFSHLHARAGDGSLNSYHEWVETLRSYASSLGTQSLKTLHCHLSGIEYGPKGERNHLMLGDSDFNLQALLRALADFDCAGRILCESPEHMDQDAQLMKAAWETVAG